MISDANIVQAVEILRNSAEILLFTGAGISVESGIPPFRGTGGLWEKHDPSFVEIDHFLRYPRESWAKLKEIFYDHWGQACPNPAHYALADLQNSGRAKLTVTQNIDCLHQRAGAPAVAEFHGTLEYLVCMECASRLKAEKELIAQQPFPLCPSCGGLLKPDVVFFGEGIPEDAADAAYEAAENCDAVIVVGTSGEVMPACHIPVLAKRRGAKVIEVNLDPSSFSRNGVSDVVLTGKAGVILPQLVEMILP